MFLKHPLYKWKRTSKAFKSVEKQETLKMEKFEVLKEKGKFVKGRDIVCLEILAMRFVNNISETVYTLKNLVSKTFFGVVHKLCHGNRGRGSSI